MIPDSFPRSLSAGRIRSDDEFDDLLGDAGAGGTSSVPSCSANSSDSDTIAHNCRYTSTSSAPWQHGPITPGHWPTNAPSSSDLSTIFTYRAAIVMTVLPRSLVELPAPDTVCRLPRVPREGHTTGSGVLV